MGIHNLWNLVAFYSFRSEITIPLPPPETTEVNACGSKPPVIVVVVQSAAP